MSFIQSWYEGMNEAERLLMLIVYPTTLFGIITISWVIPRLYGRMMGFRRRPRPVPVSSTQHTPALEVADLPAPGIAQRVQVEFVNERLRARSYRRLVLEATVIACAFVLVITFGESALDYSGDHGTELDIVFFCLWIAGTWTVRCALFARRPRVIQTTWTPMVVLVAAAFAFGFSAAALPDDSLLEKLGFGVLVFALFLAAGIFTLYSVLLLQALIKKLRLSVDTSTHVVHWAIAAVAYSLIWTIFQRNLWWLGALWLAGIPLVMRVSRLTPMPATPLVFLRNFSADRQSARLFRFVSELWLELGPIHVIVGPDVVYRLPDPAVALALITFRIRSRYVRQRSDVQHMAARLSEPVQRDGRYRTQQFLCMDETWEAMVLELVGQPDATIIMDLRGFSAANEGCERELEMIPEAALSEGRLIILVNDSTDLTLLGRLTSRRGLVADSGLKVFELDDVDREKAAALVGHAAESSRRSRRRLA